MWGMDESRHKNDGRPWLMVLLSVIVIGVMVVVIPFGIMKSTKNTSMLRATNNGKSLFYLMVEFEQDYGKFPSDATAIYHEGRHGKPGIDLRSFKGEHSNEYLGQLIAAGYTSSEEVFLAFRGGGSTWRADNIITPRERILEAGECDFSYVKNQSTSENSGRPLLLAPMAGDGLRFEYDANNGKGVVLCIDGSVKQLRLDQTSHRALLSKGKYLFEGGEDSLWGEEGFDPANLVHPKGLPRIKRTVYNSTSMTAKVIVSLLVAGIIVMFIRKRKS